MSYLHALTVHAHLRRLRSLKRLFYSNLPGDCLYPSSRRLTSVWACVIVLAGRVEASTFFLALCRSSGSRLIYPTWPTSLAGDCACASAHVDGREIDKLISDVQAAQAAGHRAARRNMAATVKTQLHSPNRVVGTDQECYTSVWACESNVF